MRREDLLKKSFQDKNDTLEIEALIGEDTTFITRHITTLEYALEDAIKNLTKRISAKTPLDASVLIAQYAAVKEAKANLKLAKEFKEEFLS